MSPSIIVAMVFLYNVGIAFYKCLVILVSPFNSKASKWLAGRKKWYNKIKNSFDSDQQPIWVHCSSLGEFEQGRPVIEAIKQRNPEKKVILTFFSPSGYEIRKNYSGVDLVCYLPLDTRRNAKKFLELTNPSVAIFVKYEFWYHYLTQLKKHEVPTYIISAIFRPDQVFFKSYGGWYRKFLNNFTHLFVQNEESSKLLNTIGISNVTVTGDTRFDRVLKIADEAKHIPIIEEFCGNSKIVVAGSTWPKDEDILAEYMQQNTFGIKMIVAPHEVHESHIQEIIGKFSGKIVRYTKAKQGEVADAQLLIIDTIGILSSVYSYGNIAYIGGGFGVGIHNTLEAAAFGMPVVFGPNYRRFKEAVDLISCGGGYSISNILELKDVFNRMMENAELMERGAKSAKSYVLSGKGSAEKILNAIHLI